MIEGEIAELASSEPSRLRFRREVAHILERNIGFDSALLHRMEFAEPVDEGLFLDIPLDCISVARDSWETCYQHELAAVFAHASASRGVAVDTDVISSSARRRMRYYAEVVPNAIRHMAWVPLIVHGAYVATLILSRHGKRFHDDELGMLRSLRPVLTLSERAYVGRRTVGVDGLTARENQIVDLLVRGFTNREIATALAMSPNTVRNRLHTIFDKLGVTTRAELSGLIR